MSEAAVYPVPPAFAAKAHVNAEKYASMYAASVADPEAFFDGLGRFLYLPRQGAGSRYVFAAFAAGEGIEI